MNHTINEKKYKEIYDLLSFGKLHWGEKQLGEVCSERVHHGEFHQTMKVPEVPRKSNSSQLC